MGEWLPRAHSIHQYSKLIVILDTENTFNTQILLYALQEFSRPPNSKSWQFQLRAAAASWFSDVFDLYATEIRVRVRSTDDATARVLSVTCKSTLSPQNRLQGR